MSKKQNKVTHASGLTDAKFDDFNDIVGDVIDKLITIADKHNIERDDAMKYFATMFGAMLGVATFKYYGKGDEENA